MNRKIDNEPKSFEIPSPFRIWVSNSYVQNREERLTYKQVPYTLIEYVRRFKWWLKIKYKEKIEKEHSGKR
jgi:hypothetical protein